MYELSVFSGSRIHFLSRGNLSSQAEISEKCDAPNLALIVISSDIGGLNLVGLSTGVDRHKTVHVAHTRRDDLRQGQMLHG